MVTSHARRWRWLAVVPLVFGMALVALLAWALLAASDGRNLVAQIAAHERPPAPAFNLPVIWPLSAPWPDRLGAAVTDGRLSLAELAGRATVINFWASWCVACQEEAPLLNAYSATHPGVRFIGIDVQDFTGDAQSFSRHFHTPYLSVHDPGTQIYRRYGLTGVPETFYLDARGRIVAHDAGGVTQESLNIGIAAERSSH